MDETIHVPVGVGRNIRNVAGNREKYGGNYMYDPTIFENLKVAFENHVYDLDNIDRKINITNRVDQMDFSIMARKFAIQFTLVDQQDVTAEIVLKASLDDLAGEILEIPGKNLGCSLKLRFYKRVQNAAVQCREIEQELNAIWENEIQLTQTLSFVYEQEAPGYLDLIEVQFVEKINEDHMEELADFLEHILESLEILQGI
ncbi:hypothetical protein MHH81_17835 [Psychrobacillus sp. FSL H8-0484]|uniref:hypothetical protein n=1 Tax=Psychrobacillus sp. FSL H8-0484 TaxID=2921390 RepID=UPI0030FCBD55